MALQSNYYPVPIVAGTTAGTYAAGDDPRLSDERTPPDDGVTNAKLANVATATIKGRATAGTGDPEDLTATQVRTILNVADGATANTASNATPSALGTAAAGSSNDFARADHVHGMPDVEDLANVSVPSAPNTDDVLAYDQDSSAWVNKDFATLASENIGPADIGAAPATGIDPTAITGTAVVDSDARLSDSRTPSSHASSHASAGSDPLFDQDLNTTDAVTFESVTATDIFGLAALEVVGVSPNRIDINGENGITFFGTTADSTRTSLGLGTAAVADIGNGAGDVAEGNHGHGNITSDGKIGSTAGLPLKTGTAGVVEAGAFGTGAGEFAEGNHTHTQLHDRSHAITSTSDHTAGNHKVFYSNGSGEIVELALGNSGEVLTSNGASAAPSFAAASGGVTGAAASASDVLGVSGSDITGVDAGSDKIVFWDDSASELTYLATVGPTFDGTTLRWPVELVVACSDETSDLTTGTAKVTFRAPYAFLLTGVRASVNTAPTGSTLIIDINNGANSALSTKLSIDASEKTSTTAASAAVIDTTYDDFSDDAEITIDIDQIGSTVAGKGLKVILKGTRA